MGLTEEHAEDGAFVITTKEGTTVIALCFIFLAYILHPLVEMVCGQIRAVHGERDIAKGLSVEVTPLPLYAEILFGRGNRWNAARVVAVLIALFIAASFGLELSLNLTDIDDGPAYRFDCPPPVIQSDSTSWVVVTKSDLNQSSHPVIVVDNTDHGRAMSRYYVDHDSDTEGPSSYDGAIATAWWWNDSRGHEHGKEDVFKFSLSFENKSVLLKNLECKNDTQKVNEGVVHYDDGDWGSFTECEEAPKLNDSTDNSGGATPTIILSGKNKVFLIMEEKSTNPSFVYSVWTTDGRTPDDEPVHITYKFHIASNARMVEAIITGIVYDFETGGECVALLWKYNLTLLKKQDQSPGVRASPFGEKPTYSTVPSVDEVESIQLGVKVNLLASACSLWLLIIPVVGGAWALRLRSRKGTDVFDLAELIKIVVANASDSSIEFRDDGAVRIFVHEEAGALVVTLEESEDTFSLYFLLRVGTRMLQQLRQWLAIACGPRFSTKQSPLPPPVNGANTSPPSASPVRDIENQAVDNVPVSPSVAPSATPPFASPAQGQYRLCVTRLRPGRSFTGTERGHGPISLTASPVNSSPTTTSNPCSPNAHALQCEVIMAHQTEGIRHLEMLEHSFSGSSATPSPILTRNVSSAATVPTASTRRIEVERAPYDGALAPTHTPPPAVHAHDAAARRAQAANTTTPQDVPDSASPVAHAIIGSSATTRTAAGPVSSSILPPSGLSRSPVPSRRNLSTEPTVGPAEFPSLMESSSQAAAPATDRGGGSQRGVGRQPSRSRWWPW